MIDSNVKYSSSAVDVTCCFHQVGLFIRPSVRSSIHSFVFPFLSIDSFFFFLTLQNFYPLTYIYAVFFQLCQFWRRLCWPDATGSYLFVTKLTDVGGCVDIRDLKQTRTATAVNEQLNFTVKNKPHTTNYIYCIFEAYFMIKSV